jgi:hypothetical protein
VHRCGDHRERCRGSVGLALFKVPLGLSHCVRHVREAHDAPVRRSGEGIQGRGFHLDGERAQTSRGRDRCFGFAIRSISRPRRARWTIMPESPDRASSMRARSVVSGAPSSSASCSPRSHRRQNWRQFALLILINGFVGGMVGIERTVVPLIGSEEFGIASTTLVVSFIVSFGVIV